MLRKSKIRCAITMGDPSGIGAEIIAKALAKPEVRKLADFVVIGDSVTLERVQPACRQGRGSGYSLPAGKAGVQGVHVIDLKNVHKENFSFGKVKAEYGKAALEYLNKGIALIKAGKIDCLVTGPVNKEAVNLAGYHFSGQTEYLAWHFKVKDVVMLLLNKRVRVSLVTRHIPLKDVAGRITVEEVFKTIRGSVRGLSSFFGILKPRLAVCGLNPHASDNGVIGDEEKRFIRPAIEKAKRKNISLEGPYPADTIFAPLEAAEQPEKRKGPLTGFEEAVPGRYDCIVCMYHDQGLIPLKLTGFNEAVNITLGLPFVRTSPGHGTAFDIAGKNKANPESLVYAIKIAIQCTRNLRNA